MPIFTSTLSNIFSILGASIQLSAVFPAMVFIAANYLIILPFFEKSPLPWVQRLIALDTGWQTALVLAAVAVISYSLTSLNVPIIRFFEGYPYRDSILGKLMIGFQRFQHDLILEQLRQNDQKIRDLDKVGIGELPETDDYDAKQEEEEIQFQIDQIQAQQLANLAQIGLNFPSGDKTLPTGLGNIVAAFEEYSYDRYKMDAVMLWPRLMPILDKQGYSAFVERQKLPLDFLLNLTVLTSVFAFEYLYTNLYFTGRVPLLELIVLAGFMYGLYRVASTAAYYWGGSVVVAFDLYRKHLWLALGLLPPKDLDAERDTWEQISQFMIFKQTPPLWAAKYYKPTRTWKNMP